MNYILVNGRMMFDGDIVLDHVDHILKNYNPGGTIDYLQYRWPLVGNVFQIPYMIDPASGDATNINAAVSAYNAALSGVIQWVPYTNQTDYIDFDLTDKAAAVGKVFLTSGASAENRSLAELPTAPSRHCFMRWATPLDSGMNRSGPTAITT